MTQTKIYLAGPIANANDYHSWRDELVDDIDSVEWINPLDHWDAEIDDIHIVDDRRNLDRYEHAVTCQDIVSADKQCLERADAVLVGYETVQQVGTPMEVMWAYERDMPIGIWIRDGRARSELSPWYRHHADIISHDVGLVIVRLRRGVEGVI